MTKKREERPFDSLKEFIKMENFLPKYCGIEITTRIRQKRAGLDSAGKPLDFSDDEYKKIGAGIKRLAIDLKKIL